MKAFLIACPALLAMTATAAFAGQPARNVSQHRHPHLAAAQRLTTQAYNHVLEAQKANEFDLGGHANKAKELLEQASEELKEAAQASNANHH